MRSALLVTMPGSTLYEPGWTRITSPSCAAATAGRRLVKFAPDWPTVQIVCAVTDAPAHTANKAQRNTRRVAGLGMIRPSANETPSRRALQVARPRTCRRSLPRPSVREQPQVEVRHQELPSRGIQHCSLAEDGDAEPGHEDAGERHRELACCVERGRQEVARDRQHDFAERQ